MQIAIIGANRNRPDEMFCAEVPIVPRIGDSIRLFSELRTTVAYVVDVQWPIFCGDLPYPVDGIAHGKPVVYVQPLETIQLATTPEGK